MSIFHLGCPRRLALQGVSEVIHLLSAKMSSSGLGIVIEAARFCQSGWGVQWGLMLLGCWAHRKSLLVSNCWEKAICLVKFA